jgi:hypothetical protein
MQQMNLFPPLGTPTQPLPEEVQAAACQQLAELLCRVLETAAVERNFPERTSHEQDPTKTP